jgi:PAS domain S-box-containing protein
MGIFQGKGKFVPMRRSFKGMHATFIFIMLGFIASGSWFSWEFDGLNKTAKLADSEMMRIYKIEFLVYHAAATASSEEKATHLGQAKAELARFETILTALRDGSKEYGVTKISDKKINASLMRLLATWREVSQPQINTILRQSSTDQQRVSSQDQNPFVVEDKIDDLIQLLHGKIDQAKNLLLYTWCALTLLGALLIAWNILYIRRRVLSPIALLMRDTEQMAKGNHAVRAEVVTNNELMLLSERFNTMAEAVFTSFATMEETIRQRSQELTSSNIKMQAFFDNAADAIISIRQEDRAILFFSRGAEKMFGYGEDEVLGKNVALLMPEPYCSDHEQYVESYLATGVKKVIGCVRQVKAKRKDGEVFEIALSVNEVATHEGTFFNAIIRDVSTVVAAQNETAMLADHMRLLMDSTGEGIYGIDTNGYCTFINRAGAEMLGYSPEELLGKNMHDTIHHSRPDGSPYPVGECPIFRAFRTGVATRIYNEWLWRKDRSYLPVEYASNPVMIDGAITGAVVTFNDISEIIKTREERDKLFNAVQQAEESIVITDLRGAIEYVNPAFEKRTGYSVAEALGQNPKILQSGKQPKEFYQEMWQTLAKGEIWRGELINKKKDGSLYHEQITISPVKNDKLETTHYVAIKNDITARKQAEEEILGKNRALEELNQRQAEIMHELKVAMDAAKDAVRAKSDFLANMSHEIRTPLNAIVGMTHLIARTPLTSQQIDYIGKIDSSAKGLMGVINDILDFSKIEAGKLDLEEVPFNLEAVLKNLANITSVKAQEKRLELLFHLSHEVPLELIGDPLRLGQVLINLTGNAIKFTKQGEVIVKGELLERAEGSVLLRFSIHDSGIGMTEAQQERLFHAFSQADTSTTREFGGTGLGLTISKQLVEMMGGEIGVESEYGKGSTFFFTARFACRHEQRNRLVSVDGLKGMPALLVDDNQTSKTILETVLRTMGFTVAMARSGEEARKILETAQPPVELVLVAWSLPDRNGVEVARQIKSHEQLPLIPAVILVTGCDLQDLAGEADEFCDGLLEKPFTPSDIFNTIMKALGKGSHDQELCSDPQAYLERVKQIRGARVLLTEDNEINQQVAREVLEGAGLVVSIANNGQEAVEMATRGDYDLILMDIQMPVMDGITATAAIRSLPNEKQRIPIIAMTAHAMSGDREKSLAAGMDDHITKPIDPELLFATLVKYIKPSRRHRPGNSRPPAKERQQGAQPPFTDLPGVDTKTGLARIGGNRALYRSLLLKFSDDFSSADTELASLLRAGEQLEALHLVHTVKGVAGNIGADELAAIATDLEMVLKNDPALLAPEVLNRFAKALRSLLAGLAKVKKEGDRHSDREPLDLQRLGEYFRSKFDMNDETVRNIIEVGLKSMSAQLDKMEQALTQSDAVMLTMAAHGLKGILLNMGLTGWAELASKVETRDQEKGEACARELLEGLRQGWQKLVGQQSGLPGSHVPSGKDLTGAEGPAPQGQEEPKKHLAEDRRIERQERRTEVTDRRKTHSERRSVTSTLDPGHIADLPTWLPGLDISGGVKRLQGNKELYLKLLLQFNEENDDILAAIMEARQTGDVKTAKRLVHTVKGSAGSINAIGLQRAAAELEKASQENAANLPEFFEKFRQTLEEVKGSINRLAATMKAPEPGTGVAGDHQELRSFFDKLAALLRRNDFKALQLWQESKRLLLGRCDPEDIEGLEKMIERFDFSAAQPLLTKIAAAVQQEGS